MPASDLVDIATACSRRGVLDTVGVVVDKLDVYRTRGSSWCITFTIKDEDFDGPTWMGGLKIKYFNDNSNVLPEVRLGDVVLLRGIRVNMFQGKPTGVASQHDMIPWAIFRADSDPTSSPSILSGPVSFDLKPLERRAASALLDRIAPDTLSPPPKSARRARVSQQPSQVVEASVTSQKKGALPISLIRDVEVRRIVQLLGQVVRQNTFDSEKTILYITDYTENPSLTDFIKDDGQGEEGDEYNYLSRRKKDWPGPWGQMNIQVTLWEPHASYAREHVKEGDLVHLTYVRIKEGRGDGIEAAVHEDRRFPEKIHVRVISPDYNEQAQELVSRKQAYWKIHGKPSDDSKKAEKKRKKNEQKQKETRMEEGQKTLPAARPVVKKNPSSEWIQTLSESIAYSTSNVTVKSRNPEVPIRSVEYILSAETHDVLIPGGISYKLPFQNVCYRLLVRVVDFFPPNLEDFAVEVPMESIVTRGDHEMDDGTSRRTEWQWRFCLLVEGTEPVASKQQPRELMKIYVAGAHGEHLLGLTATDLRHHPSRLAELEQKIFLLWGNLQEVKQQQAASSALDKNQGWTPPEHSSRPFECCIREYGVRCPHPVDPNAMLVDGLDEQPCSQPDCFGWERRFAMFGTTIHS